MKKIRQQEIETKFSTPTLKEENEEAGEKAEDSINLRAKTHLGPAFGNLKLSNNEVDNQVHENQMSQSEIVFNKPQQINNTTSQTNLADNNLISSLASPSSLLKLN